MSDDSTPPTGIRAGGDLRATVAVAERLIAKLAAIAWEPAGIGDSAGITRELQDLADFASMVLDMGSEAYWELGAEFAAQRLQAIIARVDLASLRIVVSPSDSIH